MDKERLLIKGHLLILIGGVEDKGVQEKIVQELEATEAKFPDGKLKDAWQRLLRKHKDYYKKVDLLVDDILENELTDSQRTAIVEMLSKLRGLVEEPRKSWWDTVIGWFNNATGKH
ncbi:MAG: hypothetical protein BWZ03_00019 [bacterium ADurb.BinA186]|jgi:hypothetical protein|nr:MAG: hypothetical protein BWZ03_00019 [bacterium ADurb.BinA186]